MSEESSIISKASIDGPPDVSPRSYSNESTRREIFARSRAKFSAKGTPVDVDPHFLELIEEWISGRLEMADVARSYGERKTVIRDRTSPSPPPLAVENVSPSRYSVDAPHDLLDEMERSFGMYTPPSKSE